MQSPRVVFLLPTSFREDSTLRMPFFFESLLLPKLESLPEANSVIVMDNGSAHTAKLVRALCDQIGVCGVFLLPYTPVFNPIEYASWIKQYVKRHAAHRDPGCRNPSLEACDNLPENIAASYFEKIYSLLKYVTLSQRKESG